MPFPPLLPRDRRSATTRNPSLSTSLRRRSLPPFLSAPPRRRSLAPPSLSAPPVLGAPLPLRSSGSQGPQAPRRRSLAPLQPSPRPLLPIPPPDPRISRPPSGFLDPVRVLFLGSFFASFSSFVVVVCCSVWFCWVLDLEMKGAAGEEARATMSLRPSELAEVRRSRYKVAVDAEEDRRRREDNMVEIRKSRREESLLKKRRDGLPPSVAAAAPQMAHSSALQQKIRSRLHPHCLASSLPDDVSPRATPTPSGLDRCTSNPIKSGNPVTSQRLFQLRRTHVK